MNERKIARDSNIELLRIITIMGVIILHYNNEDFGGGFRYAPLFSLNSYILYFLESIFVCAVNLFVIISGYYMSSARKVDLHKPMQLIVQTIVFQEGIYLAGAILRNEIPTFKGIVYNLLPINYFVILYVCVYCLAPFINQLLEALDEKALRSFLILSVLLFSVWPTAVDICIDVSGYSLNGLSSVGLYGSQWGYSIVNFLLMYLIGAYIRRSPKKYAAGRMRILLILAVCWMVLFLAAYYAHAYSRNWSFIYEYCNPIVILCAVLTFLLFQRMPLKNSSFINVLAKGCFTVYLSHIAFLGKLGIAKFVAGNPFILLVHIIGCCIVIYLFSWVLYFIYDKLTSPAFLWLKKHVGTIVIQAKE